VLVCAMLAAVAGHVPCKSVDPTDLGRCNSKEMISAAKAGSTSVTVSHEPGAISTYSVGDTNASLRLFIYLFIFVGPQSSIRLGLLPITKVISFVGARQHSRRNVKGPTKLYMLRASLESSPPDL